MNDGLLEREAKAFAASLASTLEGVLGETHEVHATVLDGRLSVRPAAPDGVPLLAEIDGEAFLRLKFTYSCTWDGHGKFLAVQDSEIHVLSAWDDDPLFRYEFLKETRGGIPAAHLQVHAHRDAIAYAMGYPGSGSRRAKRRLKAFDEVPHLSALHFPLGGPRFRPAMEDVLQMLIEEFGVLKKPDWKVVIDRGRAAWRTMQLQAAVRDDLEVAAEVLRLNGYSVTRTREDVPSRARRSLDTDRPTMADAAPWRRSGSPCRMARMDIHDNGPKPNAFDIESATTENDAYRRVAWTGKHLQVTLMSIEPGSSIGLEVHHGTDQFLRIDQGKGVAKMGPEKDDLQETEVEDGWSIQVPAGTWHDVENTGDEPLRLYTIYAPTHHAKGIVQQTAEKAEEDEEAGRDEPPKWVEEVDEKGEESA